MKITESKLRQMIRGVIREFTSSATAAGAKRGGYQSADTKAKKKTYDAKKADLTTKTATAATKSAAVDNSKRYVSMPNRIGGTPDYSSTNTGKTQVGFGPWVQNKAYTTQTKDKAAADANKAKAKTAKDSAQSDWEQAKEDDLQATVPTQAVPTGGGAGGFGKGKSAGKGKGKGDKKKKK